MEGGREYPNHEACIMNAEEALERAGKIIQLCEDEKWSAAEALFAAGMAYVIMTKALEETDSVIVSRIVFMTQGISVPQGMFSPKH